MIWGLLALYTAVMSHKYLICIWGAESLVWHAHAVHDLFAFVHLYD
jgi:hypothetical protein